MIKCTGIWYKDYRRWLVEVKSGNAGPGQLCDVERNDGQIVTVRLKEKTGEGIFGPMYTWRDADEI